MLTCVEINDSFTVTCSAAKPELLDNVQKSVDEIWRSAVAHNSTLFDGTILCVTESDSSGLRCQPVGYRYFFAQQTDRKLKDALNLMAVGVSGLVSLRGKVFVGIRSDRVTQCPNLFELVPSGSLPAPEPMPAPAGGGGLPSGAVDYKHQLLNELQEEAGIAAEEVGSVKPFLLVRDENEAVIDICCAIDLKNLDVMAVIEQFRSDEYTELELIAWNRVQSMVRTAPELWVPTSVLMINHLGNCANDRVPQIQ